MTPAEAFSRWRRLAYRIANRYLKTLPSHVAKEDIEAAALGGLWDAALRHAAKGEDIFVRQASVRVKGAIRDELRRQDWLTRRARDADPAIRAPMSMEELEDRIDAIGAFSIDAELEWALDEKRRRRWLWQKSGGLPEQQKLVFQRILRGERQVDIASDLGLTAARISQILAEASVALRKKHQALPADLRLV